MEEKDKLEKKHNTFCLPSAQGALHTASELTSSVLHNVYTAARQQGSFSPLSVSTRVHSGTRLSVGHQRFRELSDPVQTSTVLLLYRD